jgi:hypothetical protein
MKLKIKFIVGIILAFLFALYFWAQYPSKDRQNNFKLQNISGEVRGYIAEKKTVPPNLLFIDSTKKCYGPVLKDKWGTPIAYKVDSNSHEVLVYSSGRDRIFHTFDDDSIWFSYFDSAGHFLSKTEMLGSQKMSSIIIHGKK